MRGIVVGEFRKRKEGVPVVLLIVDVGAEKLFKGLINSFSLSVSFRVITGSEMYTHVQSFSEGSEEAGDELRTPITSDVVRNSVLGEDMGNEMPSQLFRRAGDISRNENSLLGETVDYYQDGVMAIGDRKRLYEVH